MIPNLVSLRQYVNTTLTALGTLSTRTGEVMDPDTFEVVPEWTVHYSGPVLVYSTVAEPENPVAGGYEFTVTDYTVTLPANTPVSVDDVLEVTASNYAPELVGVRFRITNAPVQEWPVARQCFAQVVT